MSGFGGGKKRLSKRLAAMPNGVRKALRAQNRKNAEELVQTMKDFAPIQDGALVSSIKRKDVSNSTRITQMISAGNREAPCARTTRPAPSACAGSKRCNCPSRPRCPRS